MIHAILLSGGSGTRLWPLSNEARSKQFLKVLRDASGKPQSMVQRTFAQIAAVDVDVDMTIATCASQESAIEAQLPASYGLVLEPERRDTAPAIMLACAHLAFEQSADAGDTVVVLPIDTFAEQAYFDKIVELDRAVQEGVADLVLLGVEPTYPSEKYGYIVPGQGEGAALPVARFKEKPNEAEATELLKEGALWNCGAFAFKLGYLREATNAYVEAARYADLIAQYSLLPKMSFDYEIVEKASLVAVVPYAGAWKDLGTWNTLSEEMADECAGRVVVDGATCSNVHAVNETGLPLLIAGMSDAVVVASPDGILVSSKVASARIKDQVELVKASRPMYEKRRWGEYRVLDSSFYTDGRRSLTKELVVESGRQLSYQRHTHRTEIWTVVSGQGEVVLDGEAVPVSEGSVVSIKPSQMHSVRALEELRIIEVQLGGLLEEEDIERFGCFWSE